jgi:glycosyltransferase involved in cell wall biosynthesis
LKNQTQLPDKVIIIEQNSQLNSVSELDYLSDDWPFAIEHVFTHQSGACNARNIGLDKVVSDWVFFADDDIRIASDFIEKGLACLYQYGQTATTFFCHKENEKPNFSYPLQWGTFGSGCSIVQTKRLQGIRFDMRYEFGFGEDGDFGIQLRNAGTDVFYFPKPDILHLKAPMGGFRTKPVLAWENEPVQPKPSPTVLLFQIKNQTIEQQRSEKVKLYINYYKHQSIKNPFRYIMRLNKQWEQSQKWAYKLLKND